MSAIATGSGYAERWAVTLILLICMAAVWQMLQYFKIVSFSTTTEGALGLTAILVIGLAASASSCLALVGGLLLSVSAAWAEAKKNLSPWRRFDPLLHFNIGRLLGYALFGGLIGYIGKSILPSPEINGILQVIVAVIMLWLGIRILHLMPKKFCSIPLPRALHKRIHALATSDHVLAPSILGALTFFIPCGFTQSMQLLALSSGSFGKGAAIMFVFAIGTLPALLGISLASATIRGAAARPFFVFAGSLSLLLGLMGIQNGLLLTGIDIARALPSTNAHRSEDPHVTIDKNGQQILSVSVYESGYVPSTFAVKAGMPTWIYATAPTELSGCIASMVIPGMGINTPIKRGKNWVGPFTPTKDFNFMCSMGMYRASVRVF